MPAKTFTVAMVERISPPPSGHVEYWDTVVPGLLLRVSFTGTKSYQVMTRVAGKRVRVTLGRAGVLKLAEAREKARAVLDEASRGADPRNGPVTSGTALRTIAADFIERYAKANTRETTWREYERLLQREVLPALGDRDVADIRRGEVVALLDRIAAARPLPARSASRRPMWPIAPSRCWASCSPGASRKASSRTRRAPTSRDLSSARRSESARCRMPRWSICGMPPRRQARCSATMLACCC
ncbi:MAG: integrase arm-type DNA-binding domain-containing protein [Candidatus Competibacteraceae bacterium]|nr:integrase arm-type DNA-binding domain-containing protein [Candidatus Competibacteraceae bacterium]